MPLPEKVTIEFTREEYLAVKLILRQISRNADTWLDGKALNNKEIDSAYVSMLEQGLKQSQEMQPDRIVLERKYSID